MRKLLLLAAVPAAILSGCMMNGEAGMDGQGTMGASAGTRGMAMDRTPTNRTPYVEMAASSDMFEIRSSQAAMARSQNPAIRQFAEMMIRDHTQMSQQLMAAAQASGMPPMSPMMMPMHAQMVARLEARSGADFDREYARQQMMAHEMALAMHSNYAARGDTPALRTVASAAVPVVTQHLGMVRRWPR
jgi:putative membrane protein